MKRFLFAAALAAASAPALAGVSIDVAQPGLYGRIDIGSFPQPQLIYPQPVIIQPVPVSTVRQPIYLHVPPGHAKDWRKHCGKYNACGQPVYFVQEGWYNSVYAPRRGRDDDDDHGHDHGKGHGNGHGKGHKNK